MRIWDIHPGYLNRQSLLGEHRELHGVVSILTQGKKGYSKHPETLRWVGHGWALKRRHAQLAAEMMVRGYQDKSAVRMRSATGEWPDSFIDSPSEQFQILREKYLNKEPGRIPLPTSASQLWSQYKYSILARDQGLYKSMGKRVAKIKSRESFHNLAMDLTLAMRITPSNGNIMNALQHMWGYVSKTDTASSNDIDQWSARRLLHAIQNKAKERNQRYLLHSTALSELEIFVA